MSARSPLTAALLLLPGLGACSAGAQGPPPVDRVFLVTCDTLRADRLGMYGYGRDVSPNLDAFARGAVVYEEAYACAPMTQPAVSSLLSGRLPTEVGVVPGNRRLMPPEVETLAEAVAAAGIETAAVVSNYVLRKHPAQPDFGVAQGFQHFDDRMPDREVNRGLKERTATRTTNAAIRWLEGHLERGAPRCFLWVHYQDPHGPYTPPEASARQFDRELGEERVPLGRTKLGRHQIPAYQVLDGAQEADLYRNRYDAEIHFFDAEVGRLLDWLGERGLLDGALVLFTADHGEALGEHDYWFCHGENLHRELVRVPFFVRAPAGFPLAGGEPGETTSIAVSHLDVYPTVLDALGLALPGNLGGASLLSRDLPEGRLLSQVLLPSENRTRWLAASDGRYRLLWNEEDDAKRLYDVRVDPEEQHDLAAQHPERVERMWEAMRAALSPGRTVNGEEMQLDAEGRRVMDALGYGGGD